MTKTTQLPLLGSVVTGCATREKCGHVPEEEMPERVLNEITRFVEES
jgi:hypothetical protein